MSDPRPGQEWATVEKNQNNCRLTPTPPTSTEPFPMNKKPQTRLFFFSRGVPKKGVCSRPPRVGGEGLGGPPPGERPGGKEKIAPARPPAVAGAEGPPGVEVDV